MNYIVFKNKKDVEKLAMVTSAVTYYDISVELCNKINRICDLNNYRFCITHNIKKKTPIIEVGVIQ